MDQNEIEEILDHINKKYDENIPRVVKMVIRRKIDKLESFNVETMPSSLKKCSFEDLIEIIKQGLETAQIMIF